MRRFSFSFLLLSCQSSKMMDSAEAGDSAASDSPTEITPPVECGLLPGTLRASMLKKKEVNEKILSLDDFLIADRIFVGNSVRGLQLANLIK